MTCIAFSATRKLTAHDSFCCQPFALQTDDDMKKNFFLQKFFIPQVETRGKFRLGKIFY